MEHLFDRNTLHKTIHMYSFFSKRYLANIQPVRILPKPGSRFSNPSSSLLSIDRVKTKNVHAWNCAFKAHVLYI